METRGSEPHSSSSREDHWPDLAGGSTVSLLPSHPAAAAQEKRCVWSAERAVKPALPEHGQQAERQLPGARLWHRYSLRSPRPDPRPSEHWRSQGAFLTTGSAGPLARLSGSCGSCDKFQALWKPGCRCRDEALTAGILVISVYTAHGENELQPIPFCVGICSGLTQRSFLSLCAFTALDKYLSNTQAAGLL